MPQGAAVGVAGHQRDAGANDDDPRHRCQDDKVISVHMELVFFGHATHATPPKGWPPARPLNGYAPVLDRPQPPSLALALRRPLQQGGPLVQTSRMSASCMIALLQFALP